MPVPTSLHSCYEPLSAGISSQSSLARRLSGAGNGRVELRLQLRDHAWIRLPSEVGQLVRVLRVVEELQQPALADKAAEAKVGRRV